MEIDGKTNPSTLDFPNVEEIAKFCRAFVAPQIFIRRHCQAMTRSIIVAPSWRTASPAAGCLKYGMHVCSD